MLVDVALSAEGTGLRGLELPYEQAPPNAIVKNARVVGYTFDL